METFCKLSQGYLTNRNVFLSSPPDPKRLTSSFRFHISCRLSFVAIKNMCSFARCPWSFVVDGDHIRGASVCNLPRDADRKRFQEHRKGSVSRLGFQLLLFLPLWVAVQENVLARSVTAQVGGRSFTFGSSASVTGYESFA